MAWTCSLSSVRISTHSLSTAGSQFLGVILGDCMNACLETVLLEVIRLFVQQESELLDLFDVCRVSTREGGINIGQPSLPSKHSQISSCLLRDSSLEHNCSPSESSVSGLVQRRDLNALATLLCRLFLDSVVIAVDLSKVLPLSILAETSSYCVICSYILTESVDCIRRWKIIKLVGSQMNICCRATTFNGS